MIGAPHARRYARILSARSAARKIAAAFATTHAAARLAASVAAHTNKLAAISITLRPVRGKAAGMLLQHVLPHLDAGALQRRCVTGAS